MNFSSIVKIARESNPDAMIVFIMDEFEKWYRELPESKILGFLDGPESFDNILIIATTNQIGNFPSTLSARPGRIEKIYSFSTISEELMESIVDSIIPDELKDDEVKTKILREVNNLTDPTIDYVRIIIRNNLYAKMTQKFMPLPTNIQIKKKDKTDQVTLSKIIKALKPADVQYVKQEIQKKEQQEIAEQVIDVNSN